VGEPKDNAANGNLDEFPPDMRAQAAAALEAERASIDKGIDAWKKLVTSAPAAWPPRRELARAYKQAERWKAYAETLKDGVDKAEWPSPEQKVPVLLEMVEVYRDRLKNDSMVLGAYNQIVTLQPGNLAAAEALAAQYEAMSKWADLISLLRKRATVVESETEKVALHLRVATIYKEKFNNQAEAMKAFEAALEIDPANPGALAELKAMYEKRRDWDRLVALQRTEVGRIADVAERYKRRGEVARLASEKLKKPAVSIELWREVLADRDDDAEALGELEKLYEREKAWAELGAVLEKQSETAVAAKKGAVLLKLALLYTEKVTDVPRAVAAWRALLQVEPDNRRAQDALRKLYLQQKDWDALESFYADQNKWDEFVRVLERQADVEEDPAKVGLLNKIGQLYQTKLAKADKAQKAFEKALALDGNSLAAAEALVPMYERAKDAARLAAVLKVQLQHTTDAAERQARMQRLVELYEGPVGDKVAGVRLALEAFREDPLGEWPRAAAERLAGDAGVWGDVVTAYEAALPACKGKKALPLLRTIARAYEKELGNAEVAIERNQSILALDADEAEAVLALERLFVATGRHGDLLAIYDKKLSLAASEDEKKEVRFALARLYEDEVKDANKAIALYCDILDTYPDELPALQALDRLYRSTKKWKELVKVIDRELALVTDNAAAAALKVRLGSVLEQHRDDADGAVEAFRDALALDAANVDARTALEKYLADSARQMKAVEALEPLYEMGQELEHLVEAQRIRLAHAKKADVRVALLLRIGAFESALGRADGSFAAYAQAFREDPTSQSARQALEELATTLDKWAELVALYDEAIGGKKLDQTLERELLLQVAIAYDERLGQAAKAVDYFRRAQEIQPEDPAALEALERLYTRTERWPDLVEVLKKKVDLVTSADERESIHGRIATIWEEAIGNADEAISAWQEVLGDNPASLQALRSLDRLYAGKGMHTELADNLQRQLALVSDEETTVFLLGRLGRLRLDDLGDKAAAVDTYRRLLDISPGHEATVEALERILPDREQELVVAEMLEPVYRLRNDFPRLIGVLEIEARHAQEAGRRIALLQEIATAFEDGCDDPGSAYGALCRALAESPLDPETERRAERLARVLGRFEDLVATYQKIAAAFGDDDVRRQLYHRIALLSELELGQDAASAAAYLKALEVAPGDMQAANELERLYAKTSDYENLVLLLQRKMVMVDATDEKKELGFKAAKVYEEVLESPEKAIEVFRQILDVDAADREALESLERLYVRLGRWTDLKDVYAKKTELAQTPEEKKRNLFVLGQVYDQELHDAEKAIETYNAVLDIDADDFEAIQALDRLYASTSRWYDLLAVLERQVQLSPSTAEVVSLRFRIGELWRTHLKDLARAADAYREVLRIEQGHDPTLKALEGMMAGPDEPVLAAQVLESIYEIAGEWERLVAVYEVMVSHADDPVRRIELLGKIADIHERHLGNIDAGFAAWSRALKVDPSNPDVIAHLDRLAEAGARWADLAAVYENLLAAIEDGRAQVETLLRVARIYEEETRQIDKAVAAYRKVSELEPDRKEGLVALDRLYSKTQSWPQLAETLRHQIRLAANEEEIIALSFRLAQVLELALGDLPKAVEAYQDILNADPNHAETRAALDRMLKGGTLQAEIAQILEPLYRLGEEWEKLAEVYQLELGWITDPEERQTRLRRLADIVENRLFDQVAAFEWWARAVLEAPGSEQNHEEALRLARGTHQWDGYVGAMLQAAEAAPEANTKRDVLLRLASVFEQDLADLARAEEVLNQILGEHPQDPGALEFLDRIYDRQGQFDQLSDILRRRIAITDDGRELVSLHLRLGRVLAEVLNDTAGATASYQAVLEHEPRSAEALDALERLYFKAERWEDLYGVYEKMLDIAPGDQALSDCYARMARITSEVFAQRERAVDLWRKVVDLRGTDPLALGALADLHEQAEEWRDLTEVLDSQIRATESAADKIPIYKRLGRIWGERLSRERNALECWQKVLELDPGDVEALRAIADNYRSAGAWEELSDTLGRLIDLGALVLGEDELKELHAQLGELEGQTLMRTDRAIAAWRQVLGLDAADFRALAALETLYTQEARWEECVEVLERRAAALAAPDDQVDVLMQVASTWVDKIGDTGAAASVYERILQIDPGNATASNEVEQLYRQRKDWDKLIELLLGRTDFVSDSKDRIALFTGIAETYEKHLGDQENAFVVLQEAFKEDFSNDFVAKELERLATVTNKWSELLTQYTQIVQTITDTKQAADLWVKIGRWYDSALNRLDYAVASVNQALALEPTHVEAFSALEDFYRKQAMWREMAPVLTRHAEVEQDSARRVEVLLRLADTYETQLGDAAQAMVAYQMALDADERCLDAIDALDRLYRRTQAWDRLVDVLSKKALVVDDGELAVRLRLQVGELWEERLGDSDRAVEAFKEVLQVDSQNADALDALARLYEKAGKWADYLEVLEHKLQVTSSEDERVNLYTRMAEVWEQQFAKPDRAVDSLKEVIRIDERSQRAYRDLERLYGQQKQWDALADIIRQHILVCADPDERTELYVRMGKVYEDELRDPDRAIEAFNDVMSFEPSHLEALRGLGRLYESTEQWERAEDVLRRLLPLVERRDQVDLNHRLGKIYDEHMRLPEIAEERLNDALSLDPAHVPSMLALLNLYRRRGDSLKAAQLMVRAETHTQNALERTRLLFESGRLFQKDLGDEDRAAEMYARTLELDPEHVDAAEPLSEIYFKRQQWQPLVPLLEMLVRKSERRPKNELNVMYYRLAKAADSLGDADRALRYYKQAYDLDSTYLPTLLDRAALLFRREQWDEAFKLYQTILVHHRDAQEDSEIVEIFHRIGQIKLKTGEKPKAINMFEKALEIEPGHKPTLEALVGIYAASGDFDAVIRQRRALLAAAADVEAKLAIYQEIIEVYRAKLKSPQKAIAAYLEALELAPEARPLLHGVLELFQETSQWKKVVEIVTRLANLESGKLKARFLATAGQVSERYLQSPDEAVEYFNQALDADPEDLKSFERIDKILTAKKDWNNQQRAYRRMIKRMGTPGPEKKQTFVALLHALGEIYRSRLKDLKTAAETFALCVQLDPDNLGRRVILAELFQMLGPEHYEKAIAELRVLMKQSDDLGAMVPHLRTLRKLYAELGKYDRAWCVASVLAFLRKADPEEQTFFEQYRPKTLKAKARLTDEQWMKNIYHPDEDRFISAILSVVSYPALGIRAVEHKQYKLDRRKRLDITNNPLLFTKAFNFAAQVMGVQPPDVFLAQESPGELDMYNLKEKTQPTPAFVVGGGLLQGRSEKQLAYVLGKKLTYMRADHLVRWPQVVPTVSELKVAFLAALKLVQPQLPLKPDLEAAVGQYLGYLRQLVPPQSIEALGVWVQKFLATQAEADLNRWSRAVDFTATRVGYLICGDLETAAQGVQAEPVTVGTPEPKEKILDLIQWTVSEEFFALREHLGQTIG
jgi:tetratricopeptide (TPR) repeat protein